MELLLHLWVRHNMTPVQFYDLPPGVRLLINAFCMKEIEARLTL